MGVRDAAMDQQLEMPLQTTVAPRRSRGWIPWLIFIAIVAAAGAYLYQRPHVEPRQPGGRRARSGGCPGI